MEYNNQDGYRFNNQHPWEFSNDEIAYVLAENGIRRNANVRPYKCWIPTIMGPVQLPIPQVFTGILTSTIYCNDSGCKVPVSTTIKTKNYIDVYGDDHVHFDHKWFHHGAKVLVKSPNNDILDIRILDKIDPSYCINCLTEHPHCNTVHGCIKNE